MGLDCDVLVFGGGPAGTATALALQARGLTTLLLEKTSYERLRPGETLPGRVQSTLIKLGVWGRFLSGRSIKAKPIVSVWRNAETHTRPSDLDPYGPGWHVDRLWFDTMLAQAAEAAGALVYCRVTPDNVERVQNRWRVTIRSASKKQAFVDAHWLVDATGRAAWLARRIGSLPRRVDSLIGIVATYERSPRNEGLLLEAAPDGWWYSVPTPTSGCMAAYLTDADLVSARPLHAFFRACLDVSHQTRDRVDGLSDPKIRVVPAQIIQQSACVGDSWLAVGDASSTLDPLTGSGISRALETGLSAAEAIMTQLRGGRNAVDEYQVGRTKQFAAHLRDRAYYYGLERRWPSSTFWRRRHI